MYKLFGNSKEENIRCIKDKPIPPSEYQQKLDALAVEVGQTYGKDEQCEMVYGKGAKICPYMVNKP